VVRPAKRQLSPDQLLLGYIQEPVCRIIFPAKEDDKDGKDNPPAGGRWGGGCQAVRLTRASRAVVAALAGCASWKRERIVH